MKVMLIQLQSRNHAYMGKSSRKNRQNLCYIYSFDEYKLKLQFYASNNKSHTTPDEFTVGKISEYAICTDPYNESKNYN